MVKISGTLSRQPGTEAGGSRDSELFNGRIVEVLNYVQQG